MRKATHYKMLALVLSFTLMFAGIGVFGAGEVSAASGGASSLLTTLSGAAGSGGTESDAVPSDAVESDAVESDAIPSDGTQSDGVDPSDGVDRTVFVDAEYVKKAIQSNNANLVIAEVSWGPDAKPGDSAYIPGAIHVNTDDLESNGQDGAAELWDLRDSEHGFKILMDTLAKNYGITKDTELICYGAGPTDSAPTRLAMAALMLGVKDVKVLDGGEQAWDDKDGAAPVSAPKKKDSFGLDTAAHPEWVISTEDMLKKVGKGNFKLVSIRSYDEFIGNNSGYAYIDKAGEPLGAIWGRDTDDGSYYDTAKKQTVGIDKLNEYLAPYDASASDELAFYCGTGWRATIPFLICYQAGIDNMKLWDDGWYVYCGAYADKWNWPGSADPAKERPVGDYPVQIGDPAKGKVIETTTGKLEANRNPLRGLSAVKESLTVVPGTAYSNFEIMPPKDGIANSVSFKSSDEKVAKVDAQGRVTVPAGVAAGKTAVITATGKATFGSTPDKEGTHKTASFKVVVGSYVQNGMTAVSGGNTVKVVSAAAGTAQITKAKNAKSVTIPATVSVNGKTLKVTGIAKNALKGSKAKTLVVKSKKLTKKSVKGALKGSKVKTVKVKVGSKKVNKKYVKKYKKIFTKKNAGKKVKVK